MTAMRRLGIILLVIGLAGFLVASSQRSGYDSLEGQVKAAVSQEERGKKDFWENARWLFLGVGVIGLVLVVLPGKRAEADNRPASRPRQGRPVGRADPALLIEARYRAGSASGRRRARTERTTSSIWRAERVWPQGGMKADRPTPAPPRRIASASSASLFFF